MTFSSNGRTEYNKKETLVRIQLNVNLNKINLTLLNILIMLNKRESTILFQWSLHLEVRIQGDTCNVGSNPTETDLRVYAELKDSTGPIGVSH